MEDERECDFDHLNQPGGLFGLLNSFYINDDNMYRNGTDPMQFNIARHIFIFIDKRVATLLQFY